MAPPVRRSELFALPMARSTPPAYVPESDLILGQAKFDYEGARVVACFDNDDVLAARFGFGRGAVDRSDFGAADSADASFLDVAIEVISRNGATLWQPGRRFRSEQVTLDDEPMHAVLPGVFEIAGWPTMRWRFGDEQREIEIDAQLEVRDVTVLPDHLTRHNLIGRWVAPCDLRATVRIGESTHDVWGLAFCDHPRVNLRTNTVPALNYYLYTPMRFDDGSSLTAYYTEDARGRPVVTQCFGLYHDAQGQAHFLPLARVMSLKLDLDRKPTVWEQRFEGDGLVMDLGVNVQATPIARAWGRDDLPQTRKAIDDLPLVFKVEGSLRHDGARTSLRGEGVAEHVMRRG